MAKAAAAAAVRLVALGVAVAATAALASCGSDSGSGRPRSVISPRVTPAPYTQSLVLRPARFTDLPDWYADQHNAALSALQRSCAKPAALNGQAIGASGLFGTSGQWQQICTNSYRIAGDARSARVFFEEWFVPYRISNGSGDRGLFTGYYEPILRGSWRRSATYRVPLFLPPPELDAALARVNGRGVTLASRAQIEAGALSRRGLELMWVDDPVDAFFLHIQGSGQVQMPDGSHIRVGYAGQNGHGYVSIGAELIRRGEIAREDMSMQAIRNWLADHPDQARELMAINPSFVFFRIIDGEGPIGAQGVPLTPGRSIAVDKSVLPYGVPVWLDTTDPLSPGAPLRRLVVTQDTGGAIKGSIRGDLFWGAGEYAAAAAGLMKQDGRWFVLLPKAAAATS